MYKIFLSLLLVFMACQNSENYDARIIKHVSGDMEEFVLKSGEYWEEYFDENAILTKKESQQTFINVFVEELKPKSQNKITQIVESLNLSNLQGRELLRCLKTEEKDLSEDCLDKIGMIMTPFATSFLEEMVQDASCTAFDYIINEPNLIEKKADSLDCQSLKTGIFFSVQDSMKIVRTDKFQVETIGANVKKLNIEWSDKCTYKLTPLSQSDTILTYEIIDKMKSGYRFISRMYIDDKLICSDIGIVQ